MAIICPAVLAANEEEYTAQINKVSGFAKRIQIDLTDGEFAKTKTVELNKVWWPANVTADIHLMYKRPVENISELIKLKPNMVIIHAEADGHHMRFAAEMHKAGIKAGLAILPQTSIILIESLIHSFDHLLIFSGDLGHFGGQADLALLEKAKQAKEENPDLEIGWDGGVNDQNATRLANGGIDVLNVGGFIQRAKNPRDNYLSLRESLGEV